MIGTSTLVVATATLAVGCAAAWFSIPRPPELEGELWFKRILLRRLRAVGADVRGSVPYHPLGRHVERKLCHPGLEALPGPALPGEEELVAGLAAIPRTERYGLMFDGGPHADLEPVAGVQDPSTWLGPGMGWEALDDGTEALAEGAERRRHARWVVVHGEVPEGTPDVVPAFGEFAQLLDAGDLNAPGEEVATRLATSLLEGLGDDPSERIIVAGVGTGIIALLRALALAPDLRDRIVAVLSVGGTIGGWEGREGLLAPEVCRDWNEAHFRHELLDVEVVREVPYLCVQWLDPTLEVPGLPGVGVHAARFGEPGFASAESPMIRVVDLGVLPVTPAPVVEEVVGALRLTTALCALTRL